MLVGPGHLALCEVFTFSRGWRRVSDLGDKVCRRCLCNAIYEHTYIGDP